eukprot:scaffold23500_cov61-Phaeocystis_antarctica.AAC.1
MDELNNVVYREPLAPCEASVEEGSDRGSVPDVLRMPCHAASQQMQHIVPPGPHAPSSGDLSPGGHATNTRPHRAWAVASQGRGSVARHHRPRPRRRTPLRVSQWVGEPGGTPQCKPAQAPEG